MSDALNALEDVETTVTIDLDYSELVAVEEAAELSGMNPAEVAAALVGDNIRELIVQLEQQKEKQKQQQKVAQAMQDEE